MNRSNLLIALAVLGLGGVFFAQNFNVDFRRMSEAISPKAQGGVSFARWTSNTPAVARAGDTIRIATFNIQAFGETKLQKPHVMDALARIVRKFDVVAIQEVRADSQDVLPEFVNVLNSQGGQYDYVIGPRQGSGALQQQFAFVFDRASVEIDRSQLYTVEDPDGLLTYDPLVAWFRVRGPKPQDAFTFSLVNVKINPAATESELNVMANVFRAVRNDGRGEDDVILLGDLNADEKHLGALGRMSGITWIVSRMPTNTNGNAQLDNVVFDQNATREFAGRGGVYDFLRDHNLSLQDALEISDHLPVWGEFSVIEGGLAGRVADRTASPR